MPKDFLRISYEDLVEKIYNLLVDLGCSDFVSRSVSIGLSETSLRGVDSHGIRLLPHYVRSLNSGRLNGNPHFKLSDKYSSFIAIDADNSFGHAAGFYAIDQACLRASQTGVCVASVFNSSHPGAMASYVYRAAENGFAAFAFTHADSLIQSHLGNTKFFGTNPICFGAPRRNEPPFCVDMAPSYIPWNKILNCIENNQQLDGKYAVTADGLPTNNPCDAVGLLPIAGHKGFALAAMVEVLCSCFTGMNFGPNLPTMYGSPLSQPRHLGQFYIVFKVDGGCDESSYYQSIHDLGDSLRNSSPGMDVMMPNDPQIRESLKRSREGIVVPSEVRSILNV